MTLFQVDFSNVEKKEEVGIHEDAPVGYCGLTQGQCPSSSVCISATCTKGSTTNCVLRHKQLISGKWLRAEFPFLAIANRPAFFVV
jgi:hypothetical protein